MIAALLLGREGSTAFPGKNTSLVLNRPMMVYPLLAAKHSDWSPKCIARQLIETCDNVVNPSDRGNYWGRVNAYTALSSQGKVPTLVVEDYSIDGKKNPGRRITH